MSLPHAASGEVINLPPLGDKLTDTISTALVSTPTLEVMRLILPTGKTLPDHDTEGEQTIHCLEGAVEIDVRQKTVLLRSGEMIYLAGGEPHRVCAIENSCLLVTLLRDHTHERRP